MRGLPDSVIYGTYKRSTRNVRRPRKVKKAHPLFEIVGWVAFVLVVIFIVL